MITNDKCQDLLTYAKLPPKGFHKIIQTITFSQDFNKENYSIFKVNKGLVKSLEENQTTGDPIELSIKGSENDQAVICTNDQTYEISESETSNTLLIIPKLEIDMIEAGKENDEFTVSEVCVLSSCNKIYDLKERRAKIGEVYKILDRSMLHHHIGDDYADSAYSFSTLLEMVLMSKLELVDIIKKLKVFKYGDDRLRLLNVDYVSSVILRIMDCALETDSDIHNISQKSVHCILDVLYPKCILDQTLEFYFSPNLVQDDDTIWEINNIEISKCVAERILNKHKEMSVVDFMYEWRKILPEEIEISLSYLNGVAIVNDSVEPKTVKLLRALSLPDDAEGRFRELFSHKSHWRQEDLEGYVQDIVPNNESAAQLLLKYCRCSNIGGTKMFSRR